jgi:hypothetical protein
MFISVPIRWTIVAGLCAALLGWYLIWGKPDTMPTPDFEYYTEGAKGKVSLAGKPVVFQDLSKDAYSIKWTFPNGETFTEKKVIHYFTYEDVYDVKLQAFSRSGELMKEKVMRCRILADYPENMIQVRIIFEGNKKIRVLQPLLRIGPIIPHWCGNTKECIWNVPKGVHPYIIHGSAFNSSNSGDTEHCDKQGSGEVEFVSHATYRIYYVNLSTCLMKLEKVSN